MKPHNWWARRVGYGFDNLIGEPLDTAIKVKIAIQLAWNLWDRVTDAAPSFRWPGDKEKMP